MSLVQELTWCRKLIKEPVPIVSNRVMQVLSTLKIGKKYTRAQIHEKTPFDCTRYTIYYLMDQAVTAGLVECEKMEWPKGNKRKSIIYWRVR